MTGLESVCRVGVGHLGLRDEGWTGLLALWTKVAGTGHLLRPHVKCLQEWMVLKMIKWTREHLLVVIRHQQLHWLYPDDTLSRTKNPRVVATIFVDMCGYMLGQQMFQAHVVG